MILAIDSTQHLSVIVNRVIITGDKSILTILRC
jgi:hypothetical protein